jgi:hypothetical protein
MRGAADGRRRLGVLIGLLALMLTTSVAAVVVRAVAQPGDSGPKPGSPKHDAILAELPPAGDLSLGCAEEAGAVLEDRRTGGATFEEAAAAADAALLRCQQSRDTSGEPSSFEKQQFEEQQADCRQQGAEAYERAKAEGKDDGDARRERDEARARCEGRTAREPDASAAPEPRCNDRRGRHQPTSPPQAPDRVAIYLTCDGEVGSDSMVLYRFERQTKGATGRIAATFKAYLAGATSAQRADGFDTALGAGQGQLLQGLDVNGGVVTLDFAPGIEDLPMVGTSTASSRLLRELAANAFQFDSADRLRLETDGSCPRFWTALSYGPTCHELSPDGSLTPHPEAGT